MAADDAVRAGRVMLLYRQSHAGFLITLAVALVCGAVLWNHVPNAVVAGWMVAASAVTAARFALTRSYLAREGRGLSVAAWERNFSAGAAAMGCVWGALAAGVNAPSFAYQVFIAFVIGGMVIGSMGVLVASRMAFAWFAIPALGAQVAEFFLLGGQLYAAMGLLGLVFLGAVLRVFEDLHAVMVQNIQRGIANERLLAEQRSVFDAATVGIVFLKDCRLIDCNPQFERMFGYAADELRGASSRTWFHDDDSWNETVRAAHAHARAGHPYRTELRLKRKNGQAVWCDLSAQAVIAGQPELGLVVVYADVTDRKCAEEALRASEAQLDLVVRASQAGFWDWDIDVNRAYYSPRFKEILGYAGDADFDRLFAFAERLHADDRDLIVAAQARCLADDTPFDHEYRLRKADGHYVWVHGRGQVVRDAAGRAVRFAGSIIDVSDRKAAQDQLRDSEQHFRRLVETANDLVWAVDREGRWTYLSPRATRQIFGCEPAEMLGQPMTATQPEEERMRTTAMLARALDEGTTAQLDSVHLNRRGERVVLSFNATPLHGASGSIQGVTGTAADIGKLKAKKAELSAALAEQELIFDSMSEGLVFLKNHQVYKCNSKFAAMLGYRRDELVGKPSLLWHVDPIAWEHVNNTARVTMASGQVFQGEVLVRRKSGEGFWCDVRGRAVDAANVDAGSIWVFIDISARKEREERIQHLADHDALTGLLNRRLLEDRLQQAVNLARRNDTLLSVMLVDLDGFKAVNDNYGHLMGDYVLRTVAKRLKECVRESDTVARLGGDEFVVLLVGQRSTDDSVVVAEKILAALSDPVAAGGRRFMIGGSIGISIFPRDGDTGEALLKHADAAMYRVKDAGKNRFEFYS